MAVSFRREPDFANLAAVLEKKVPTRPVFFEFYMNQRLYQALTADLSDREVGGTWAHRTMYAYARAGFDHFITAPTAFAFPAENRCLSTMSINDSMFSTREGFDAYRKKIPDPGELPLDNYLALAEALPGKMKLIPSCPNGILENVIRLVGYENLCIMRYEDEELFSDIFEYVGSLTKKHILRAMKFDFVGAIMLNDDWGFNTQTMLSPADLRKYVFPWYKEVIAEAHACGKYAILHSCGAYRDIIGDIIDDMKFDARHSYEDNIVPVEKAYEELQGKLAVLGGIDINFLVNAGEDEIRRRCRDMLDRAASRGGYALGSGNSIPEYIPDSHFYAMMETALAD